MKEKKKYCTRVLMTLLVGAWMIPQVSFAAVADDAADPDTETPAFTSPAEALHAANLAEQAATSDSSIQDAMQDVQDAQDALDSAIQSDDPDAIEVARTTLTDAETAYTDSLSEITGVIDEDITSMRDSGMGWGEIAHELGVQPGLLGLGYTRGEQNHFSGDMMAEPSMHEIDQQELAEATARNMESGWSRGHGVGVQSGVHDSPGAGLSDDRRGEGPDRDGDQDHDGGGVSGAGGLGGGSSDNGSSDHGGGGDAGESHGGAADSGGSPGGSSGSSDHGAAGPGGSPGGSSSSSGSSSHSGSSSGSSSAGSSSDHSSGSSNSGDSEGHGGSDGGDSGGKDH